MQRDTTAVRRLEAASRRTASRSCGDESNTETAANGRARHPALAVRRTHDTW